MRSQEYDVRKFGKEQLKIINKYDVLDSRHTKCDKQSSEFKSNFLENMKKLQIELIEYYMPSMDLVTWKRAANTLAYLRNQR